MTLNSLRCEHLDTPLAVHAARPRLSWMIDADPAARGIQQMSRQVLVASSPEKLREDEADLWDSGRVESSDSLVIYGGKPLTSFQKCFWKTRVWNAEKNASQWSDVARFEIGLLDLTDWKAKWIGAADSSCPAPLFRKQFQLTGSPKAARAYVCGLGYYELNINGKRVGDHVLDPAQTDYETRALYVAHDVTELLREGDNVVGVMLGKGWFTQDLVWGGMSYGQPRFIFQLRTENEIVVSDTSWRTTPGPVTENNVYAGETYDARREIVKWNDLGCDDHAWLAAVEAPSPTKSLEPQLMPPIRRVRTLAPIKITPLKDRVHVVDFGQNFAGWVRISTTASAGTAIRIRTAEAINSEGALDTASTGVFATRVEQTDTYICKGGGVETWEPRFTYHGFRYAEITGMPDAPTRESVTGVVVHSDVEPIGSFECSDEMLNRIQTAARWTLVSNLHGVPTDCPAREKCGWLGDAQITAEFALCNFDAAALLSKYVRDIETTWRGNLPGDVAPGKRCSNPDGHLDWGLAVVLVPWFVYLYRGDESILREHYPSMKKFMDRAKVSAPDGIYKNGYGDWCPPGSVEPTLTPPALTTTAWFAKASSVMSHVAKILGENDDVKRFADDAERISNAFQREFFDTKLNTFGSQTANAMALELDLVSPANREAVAENLQRDVMVDHSGHHTTGIFGSRFLFDALANNGHGDAALTVLRQQTYPSIGHLFSLGATTMWECWGEPELDKKWGARSQNHPMQAAFTAWFYHGLAGIAPSPDGPGFKRFILRPQIVDDAKGTLTWVRAKLRCPHGTIASGWEKTANGLKWHVEVPPNTTATIHIPARDGDTITEQGKDISTALGLRHIRRDERYSIFEIVSGVYDLAVAH